MRGVLQGTENMRMRSEGSDPWHNVYVGRVPAPSPTANLKSLGEHRIDNGEVEVRVTANVVTLRMANPKLVVTALSGGYGHQAGHPDKGRAQAKQQGVVCNATDGGSNIKGYRPRFQMMK